MFVAIFIGLISIIFFVIGYLIWKKEKTALLHSYHYDKVKDEDKKAFCKLSGIGIVLVGAGLFITAVIIGITNSPLSFIAFAIGFVAGISLLIYAGIKYNLK